jgi:hypothetical protein
MFYSRAFGVLIAIFYLDFLSTQQERYMKTT